MTVVVTSHTENQHDFRASIWEADRGVSRKATLLLTGTLEASAIIAMGAAVKSAKAGNTGDGTIGAVTVNAAADHGRYTLTLTAATTFTVTSPTGEALAAGSTGVAYTDALGFTVTAGGTAFIAGDELYIDIGIVEFDAGGAAPTNSAYGMLGFAADADAAAVDAVMVHREAVLNALELVWKTGTTEAQKRAAYDQLAAREITVRRA